MKFGIKRPYKGPAHTAKGSKGSGDWYGTAVRNKMCRLKSPAPGATPMDANTLKKPPRSLA